MLSQSSQRGGLGHFTPLLESGFAGGVEVLAVGLLVQRPHDSHVLVVEHQVTCVAHHQHVTVVFGHMAIERVVNRVPPGRLTSETHLETTGMDVSPVGEVYLV